jgi:hypothetical protein
MAAAGRLPARLLFVTGVRLVLPISHSRTITIVVVCPPLAKEPAASAVGDNVECTHGQQRGCRGGPRPPPDLPAHASD